MALGLLLGFPLVATQVGWAAPTSELTWAILTHNQIPKLLRTNAARGYLASGTVVDDYVYMATVSGLWQQAMGSKHWSRIPTRAIVPITTRLGYRMMRPIVGVVVAAEARQRIFVIVPGAESSLSAPPVFDLGLYTLNDGQKWRAVPVPPGLVRTNFGGFQPHGSSVWSWWETRTGHIQVWALGNYQTIWHRVLPARTAHSPIFLGPVPAQNDGPMAPETEPLVAARAAQWQSVARTVVNQQAVPTELAFVGTQGILWVGNVSHPLQWTGDDGRHWQAVTVPSLPGWRAADGSPALTLLSNGDLFGEGPSGPSGAPRWYRLPPGSSQWHRIDPHGFARAYAVIPTNGFLLWLQPNNQLAAPPRASELQVERVVHQILQVVPTSQPVDPGSV
jgi:hypothetical protein